MRHITTLLILIFSTSIFAQNNVVKTAGVSYTAGAPTFSPGRTGSQVAIDTVTGLWYEHNGTSWSASGYRVQTISGCSAPAYTPEKYQSRLVINACTAGQGGPELYYWTGSVWLQINEGQTYTAGTGISIVGSTITNTGDLSNTNELQTLSIDGQDLTLSGGGGTVELPGGGDSEAPILTDQIALQPERSPQYQWSSRTSAVRSDHWTDGVIGVSFRDTLLSLGGWYDTPTQVYDTILYSTNDGATWAAYPGRLPFKVHTFAFCKMGQYYYVIGGDYLSTSTQRKSVYRTDNFRTWELMTSNAEFGERILSGAISYNNVLYLFGGQTGLSAGLGKSDVWKSVNNGANWARIQDAVTLGGISFLGTNITNQVKILNGKVYAVGAGGYYGTSYSNRVYSIPIEKIEDKGYWRLENPIPSTGKSYVAVEVWDGKIWAIGGYDSTSNTRVVYAMSQSGIWRAQKSYYGDYPGANTSITHAPAITVHKDRLFRFLGNFSNECYMLSRSNDIDTLLVNTLVNSKTLTKTGQYTYNSETQGGLGSVFGNNIVAGTADNTIKRLLSDNGNYMNMRYDRGLWFGAGMSSTVGSNFSDTTASRMRILSDGRVVLSNSFNFHSPLSSERLQVNGAIYSQGVNTTGNVAATATVSGQIGAFTGTAGTSLPVPLVVTATTSAGGGTVARITNTTTSGYSLLTFNETNNTATPFYMARYGSTYSGTPNLFELVSTAGSFSLRPFAGVAIGATTPSASAKLDVTSTTSGFLPPRMTTAQRNAISSPATGLTLYCTDCTATDSSTGVQQVYNGSTWKNAW